MNHSKKSLIENTLEYGVISTLIFCSAYTYTRHMCQNFSSKMFACYPHSFSKKKIIKIKERQIKLNVIFSQHLLLSVLYILISR